MVRQREQDCSLSSSEIEWVANSVAFGKRNLHHMSKSGCNADQGILQTLLAANMVHCLQLAGCDKHHL
jgi:hypothetical protein